MSVAKLMANNFVVTGINDNAYIKFIEKHSHSDSFITTIVI